MTFMQQSTVTEQIVRMPDERLIGFVMEAYERGQTIEALKRAEEFAPLKNWHGVIPCVLAARIAANAGAPRLGTKLSLRAWKTDKTHPEGLAQYAYEVFGRRGPLALWQLLREWKEDSSVSNEQRAALLALKARAASQLRDFSTAENLLARAESIELSKPWIRLQRAYLLESQDKIEEALEITKAAIALHPHPFYRPGVQTRAHLLQLLNRDEDAIEFLRNADSVLQNGLVAVQLYSLLSENGKWSEAEVALERYVELSPLQEPPLRKWLASQRARVAYHLDRRAEAVAFLSELQDDFHHEFREKLIGSPPGLERVQLDVTFVRQHFKTCAPATLAALGRFWGMPAEHLKVAEATCYDGTPHWKQRDWAEKNGWYVREFRMTHESAVTMIEKGVPFAISTVEATSAHMMAVIGFDRTRGTLLLRDPGQPYLVEFHAKAFLKRYQAFGPHGMVFVPVNERGLLDGVNLPDAELYDDLHKFWLALVKHDRETAATVQQRMQDIAPDAPLSWEARLEIATYDANIAEQARCLDKLLELFPNNAARLLRRLGCLADAPREERIKFLEAACATREADPALFVAFARALRGDARCDTTARHWCNRAIRLRPMDSSAISALGDLLWESNIDEATELFRFAAYLEGFRENLYQSWFVACRRTRRTEEALAHLQDRFSRFGSRSEQPGLTLAWALRDMDQPARARDVLNEAILLRPDDGYLMLRASSLMASLAGIADADKFLNAAKGKVRENDWLRAAAEIAENRFDFEASMQSASELLKREPIALDGHATIARGLAMREGMTAARAHLENACSEFPHHYGLQRMLVDWSRDAGPECLEAAARKLLQVEPADAWARREITLALVRLKRREDALREASEAARIEPGNTYSYSILGHVHRELGQLSEARAQYRKAVKLSVDNSDAVNALLGLAWTDKERKDELEFVEQELVRQVVTGDGLLVFLELARPVFEPEILLRILQLARTERPDLWHAWAALVSQLAHVGRLDEALSLARQASERFEHLPRIWLDLAMVHQCRNEPEQEVAAAARAFEMNPSWNRSTLALANALERRGRLDDARRVYERALRLAPRDAELQAFYASLLWRQQQNEAAFAAIEKALRLAPVYDWGWGVFIEWATQSGQQQRTAEFARALTKERPGEMRVWLTLARVLAEPANLQERLAAVERAIDLDSHATDARDLKAELLTYAERFEDAIKACVEGVAVCSVDVHILRGRQAWIEAQRRELPEAIRLMRAVLSENVSYVWGWHQLVVWLLEQGALTDATTALEQLQRLRPHDAWVNRQLGFMRLKQENRAGAQKAFETALTASPTDAASAHNLLDLQMQSGNLVGAATTLQTMKLHQPGAATLTAEILLQVKRGEYQDALKNLETLCSSPDPDPWSIDTAANAFARSTQGLKVLKIFKRALKSSACNPQIGAAAIRLMFARNSPLGATRLFGKLPASEIQRRAAAPLVEELANRKDELLLRWVLWRHRKVLLQDAEAWGQVGYGLIKFNRMKQVARWLADWQQRNDVQPWMLFNLCLALRHLGRYEEATTVARHVLRTWGHRPGSADMRLFLAVEEALAGALPAASEHLQQVIHREDVAHDRQLLALAKALIQFQQAAPSDRRRQFQAIREQLGSEFSAWKLLRSMRDIRRTFRRTGKVFHHQGGGIAAWLWFNWKLNWQWSLLPLAPFALALAIQPPVLIGLLMWRMTRNRNRK